MSNAQVANGRAKRFVSSAVTSQLVDSGLGDVWQIIQSMTPPSTQGMAVSEKYTSQTHRLYG